MAASQVLLVTSDDVPGRQVTEIKGLIRGHSVRARNVGRDLQAGLRSIVGGKVGVYAELLESSREEALAQIIAEAQKLNANAVVAVRMSTSQIMGGASEVLI